MRGSDTYFKSCNNVISTFTINSRNRREKGRPGDACESVGKQSEKESLAMEAIMSWELVVSGHIQRLENDSFLILQIIIKLPVAFDRLIQKISG